MTERLTKMVITRVDLVDKPANPGERVVFFKRDEAEPEGTVKRVLKNLKIDEISLVDSPANKGCFVKLIKRDGSASSPERTMPMDPATEFTMRHGLDFNKAAIADEIDRKGGAAFLETDAGRDLYKAYREAPAGPIAKAKPAPAPAMRHEDEILDALAKQEAQRTGLPFAKAYDSVLKRPDGQAVYAKRQGYAA